MPPVKAPRSHATPEHAFAGASVPFPELYQINHGTITYRTRCGLYVPAGRLVSAQDRQPVRCAACQAARENRE